jgi:hypothetical protein
MLARHVRVLVASMRRYTRTGAGGLGSTLEGVSGRPILRWVGVDRVAHRVLNARRPPVGVGAVSKREVASG